LIHKVFFILKAHSGTAANLKGQLQRQAMGGRHPMKNRKDRRKPADTPALPFEDLQAGISNRRKQPDRRLENLNAEERQLLFSEMPGHMTTGDKD